LSTGEYDKNGNPINRSSVRKSSKSKMSSSQDSSNGDKRFLFDDNEDEKKLISEKAEELERKLIDEEFYRHYNFKVIYAIFLLIFISNIFINIDHGSLPGCSVEIKKDLDMNDFEFGLLGSVVYGGLTLGSAVATGVYSKSKLVKPTLALTLFCNALCIYAFTTTDSFYFDAFHRFMIGFF
jgi:sugar phosphate permease